MDFLHAGKTMQDFYFNQTDLTDGKLFVAGAEPGDFVVIAGNGELCLPDIKSAIENGVSGTIVFFQQYVDYGSDYRIKFISGSSSQFKVQYAPAYNGEWHDEKQKDDKYMRFSSDGGSTWAHPVVLAASSNSAVDYDGEYISNYIVPINTGDTCVDTIVNTMVYPQINVFCEIQANYEVGLRQSNGSYRFSYKNWNSAFKPEVFLNGADTQLNDSMYSIDYAKGIITPSFASTPGDNLICTYNFSWFTPAMLKGYVVRSLGTINNSGNGAVTSYTTKDLPVGWYGISADLCIAMCMESLIAGYTMWVGRLIFAISPNGLYDGNDNIISQLELLKRNAEERAYKALDNPKMRAPDYLAPPTPLYWRAVSLGNGVRLGPHGQMSYGKTRGQKWNKMVGMVGPDVQNVDLGV